MARVFTQRSAAQVRESCAKLLERVARECHYPSDERAFFEAARRIRRIPLAGFFKRKKQAALMKAR